MREKKVNGGMKRRQKYNRVLVSGTFELSATYLPTYILNATKKKPNKVVQMWMWRGLRGSTKVASQIPKSSPAHNITTIPAQVPMYTTQILVCTLVPFEA